MPLAVTTTLLTLVIVSCAPSQASEPIAIVQAALDRMAEGDVDGFLGYCADDAVFFEEGHPVAREALRDGLMEMLAEDYRFEFSDLAADGNVVTYTVEILFRDTSVAKSSFPVDVVVDGQIVVDGHRPDLLAECERDPSQVFCGGD